MEILKARTAAGRGTWGHVIYDVELITTIQYWSSSQSPRSAEGRSYTLSCSEPAGARHFSSEEERQAFISESFSTLDLHQIDPPDTWQEPSALHTLHGQGVVSVAVLDGPPGYELRWAEDRLWFYSDAVLIDRGVRITSDDAGFHTALRKLVGSTLQGTEEFLDRGFLLYFDGQRELEISVISAPTGILKAIDYSSDDEWTRGAEWLVGEWPFGDFDGTSIQPDSV